MNLDVIDDAELWNDMFTLLPRAWIVNRFSQDYLSVRMRSSETMRNYTSLFKRDEYGAYWAHRIKIKP